MPSSGDDARKKRQVDPSEEEKPKKVRADDSLSTPRRVLAVASSTKATPSVAPQSAGCSASNAPVKSASPTSLYSSSKTPSTKKVWDIESALLYLVQIEGDFTEYLTHDKSTWVTFRVGHAGDASTIASWYRRAKNMEKTDDEDENPELDKKPPANTGSEEETTSNMLEVWLADGMGDEGNHPSLFSLIAHVHKAIGPASSAASKESLASRQATSTKYMGAAALLTITFTNNERVLRVEWMGMHPDLSGEVSSVLQQRMWLRLSTVSVMTACQVVEVDRQQTINAIEKNEEHSNKPRSRTLPSAE